MLDIIPVCVKFKAKIYSTASYNPTRQQMFVWSKVVFFALSFFSSDELAILYILKIALWDTISSGHNCCILGLTPSNVIVLKKCKQASFAPITEWLWGAAREIISFFSCSTTTWNITEMDKLSTNFRHLLTFACRFIHTGDLVFIIMRANLSLNTARFRDVGHHPSMCQIQSQNLLHCRLKSSVAADVCVGKAALLVYF